MFRSLMNRLPRNVETCPAAFAAPIALTGRVEQGSRHDSSAVDGARQAPELPEEVHRLGVGPDEVHRPVDELVHLVHGDLALVAEVSAAVAPGPVVGTLAPHRGSHGVFSFGGGGDLASRASKQMPIRRWGDVPDSLVLVNDSREFIEYRFGSAAAAEPRS